MRGCAILLLVTAACGPPRNSGAGGAAAGGHGAGGEVANAGNTGGAARAESPGSGDLATGEMRTVLDAHNRLRAKHCAPALSWSNAVARVAQRWADELGARCALQHSAGEYGENLAAGSEELMDAEHVVDMWYSEVDKYDFKRGGFSMQTGHFTQLVWRDTARLGCGVSACKGMRVWVCNYDPPGNVEGEYRDNVRSTGCR